MHGSSDGDVGVRFRIFLGGHRYLEERELAHHRLDLDHRATLKGQVEMTAANGDTVSPEDELVPLILGLCFDAAAELTRSDHVVVAYVNDYGYLRLDREADLIRVSGDGVPLVRFPERGLLPALVSCGARFRAWALTTVVPGEDQEALRRELDEHETAARAALAARPGLSPMDA